MWQTIHETFIYIGGLGTILKVVQILSYIVAGAVAIFTYRSAIRGWLTPINTEYQKKVIETLDKISIDLASEFDLDSPNSWLVSAQKDFPAAVKSINQWFINDKEAILSKKEFHCPIPVLKEEMHLDKMLKRIISDPFIPSVIRSQLAEFLSNRTVALRKTLHETFEGYQKALAQGKYQDSLDENHSWLWNKFIEVIRKKGFGIEKNEETVNRIRIAIQEYFESFDPRR